MKLRIFFRKSKPGFFSIENVFQTLIPKIQNAYPECEVLRMPKAGASFGTILSNLQFTKQQKGQINHITGDVHYIALATGKKTVLTIHDIGSALEGPWLKKYYIRLFWFYLPVFLVKKVTVISEFTKQQLIQLIPSAKHKIQVIPNAVDADFTYQPKDFNTAKPNILCVGTKSNKNLLRIFESLKDMHCEVHIIGQLNQEQKEGLKTYRINYTNKANLSQKEVVQAYQNCDLLCFPSTYEGFGMPIVEAQATGRPVITSNLGAMKEIAKGTACLVDPYSVASIKTGIEKIIADESYRTTLIEQGLANAQRFQIETVAQQYIAVYSSLVEE